MSKYLFLGLVLGLKIALGSNFYFQRNADLLIFCTFSEYQLAGWWDILIKIPLQRKMIWVLLIFYCQAQPKPKPNYSWAVLLLNPTSPTGHPATRPSSRLKKYKAGTFEPGLQNKGY